MSGGTLSDNKSSGNSNKNKIECEKNKLYFDDDTVAMSNDNCTINTSLSKLSDDSARNVFNQIEIYNILDDVVYNAPLPKCKHVATETPTRICTSSTIGAVHSRRVL